MFKVGDTGKTRSGLDYRVICVDAMGDCPIVALLTDMTGKEVSKQYTKTGFYYSDKESRYDIIRPSVREVRYCAIYNDCSGDIVHDSPEKAAAFGRIHGGQPDRAIEITFEDGKPVEARIVFVGDGK